MAKIVGTDGITLEALMADVQQGGRFVYFPYVFSLLIMSFRRASDIYYVPSGQSAALKGLPFALISLLLGWWGLPWGLIWTPGALITTLSGGKDVTQQVMASLTIPPGATRSADSSTVSPTPSGSRPKLRCDVCRQHVRAVLQGTRYACPYCGNSVPSPGAAPA